MILGYGSLILLLVFTFAFRPKQPAQVVAASPAQAPVPLAPTPQSTPDSILADLNKDGKIDVQELLKALQEQQKNQKKEDE